MSNFFKNAFRFVLITFLCVATTLFVANTPTHATSFRPQINVTNSTVPTPEPGPSNTGAIEWLGGQVQGVNEGVDAVVEIDYDLQLFKSLTVDGKTLTLNADFYLDEGSTIITLQGDFMASLSAGTHSLTAYYSDGKSFDTTFLITSTPIDVDPSASEPSTPEPSALVPNTGANQLPSISTYLKNNSPLVAITLFVIGVAVIVIIFSKKRSHSKQPHGLSLHTAKFTRLTVSIMAFVGMSVLCFNFFASHTETQPAQAIFNEEGILSISTNSENFTADVDLADGGAFVSTSQTISVDSATSHGYQLFISSSSADYNELSLNGSTSSEASIVASDGTINEPITLADNTWGYALTGGEFGANYAPSSNSKWAGIPTLGSETLIKNITTATAAGDSTTIYYGFNIAEDLPEGSYYGANNSVVVYTAVVNVMPSYEISYDCNGGDGNIPSALKEYDVDITLSDGAECSLGTRELQSWNTISDGSGETYALGATYSQNENLNLYAIWAPEPTYTYTLSYDANGGTNAPAKQSQTTTVASATFTIRSAKPTRANYKFKGWCSMTTSNASCSGTTYQPGGSLTTTDTSTTLYAIWEAEPEPEPTYTYTLDYDANGGTNAPASQSQTTTATSVTFTISSTRPTRTNYDFIGWCSVDTSNTSCSGTTYQPGGSLTATNTSTTLYAIWSAKPAYTYTLSYNANGGTNAPAKQSKTTTATSATFTIRSAKPTRTNYEFKGWCSVATSNASCSGTTYQPSGSLTLTTANASITLYAIWRYNGPIPVSSIAISGTNTILLNSANPKTTLTATVLPSNATNKSVSWSSSNSKVATVSSTGVVTGVEAGTATITATAKDGSGRKATYKVTVKKKVIIILGASQLGQINGGSDGQANIKNYTSQTSGNNYVTTKNNQYSTELSKPKALDNTLNFIYYNAHGFQFETGKYWDGYENKDNPNKKSGWSFADQIVKQYSTKKDQVEFYIYFTISSNDSRFYSCDQIKNNASREVNLSSRTIKLPTISNQAKTYNDLISGLKNEGFNAKGYVVSTQPIKPSQGTPAAYLAENGTTTTCTAGYASNYKTNLYNNKIKNTITSSGYSNITYIDTFHDILNVTTTNTPWSFKSNWSTYNTTDGLHWDKATAIKYFNYLMNLNTTL